MISAFSAAVFVLSLIVVVMFSVWSLYSRKHRYLLHRLYLFLMWDYSLWAVIMLLMFITPPERVDILQFLDSLSYLGTAISPFYLLICYTFTKSADKPPKWFFLPFIVPVLAFLICLTNDWHHLQYQVFSVIRSEIVFGPYVFISGANGYICVVASMILLVTFARRNPSRLYIGQCSMLAIGGLIPFLVSLLSTFSGLNFSIAATPLSFSFLVLFNGIAIYRLNLLDITPVATQHVLDWISDCYLILSPSGLIISYNKPFAAVFASRYGIMENRYLKDCVKEEDISKKTAIYNIMTAVDACREAQTTISYEQSVVLNHDGAVQKSYYVTDVSQLIINDKPAGFVVIFKDITQLKKSMQQLQDSQSRMMEQERFAFLGQMIGGLAHNLKTPIMGISGCISAADTLIDECLDSLDDPNVNQDDYREIYGEMRDWYDNCNALHEVLVYSDSKNEYTSDDSISYIEEYAKIFSLTQNDKASIFFIKAVFTALLANMNAETFEVLKSTVRAFSDSVIILAWIRASFSVDVDMLLDENSYFGDFKVNGTNVYYKEVTLPMVPDSVVRNFFSGKYGIDMLKKCIGAWLHYKFYCRKDGKIKTLGCKLSRKLLGGDFVG